MLITKAIVNHDRPGAQAGKVGKLLPFLARDDVGRGIKAVINYAITRFYLKIKTVFFASMRLTDCHYSAVSLLLFSSFSLYFLSPSIFKWQILRLRRMRVSTVSPTHPTFLAFDFFSLLRFFAISWAAYSYWSFCYTRFPRHPWFRAHFRRPKAVPFSPLNQLCALHKSPSNHYAWLSFSFSVFTPPLHREYTSSVGGFRERRKILGGGISGEEWQIM